MLSTTAAKCCYETEEQIVYFGTQFKYFAANTSAAESSRTSLVAIVKDANERPDRQKTKKLLIMDKGTQTMIENMYKNTGKTLEQWIDVTKKENLAKHGEMVKFL